MKITVTVEQVEGSYRNGQRAPVPDAGEWYAEARDDDTGFEPVAYGSTKAQATMTAVGLLCAGDREPEAVAAMTRIDL